MNCIEPTECLATVSISRRNNLRLLRALNMSNLSTSSSFSSLHSPTPTSHDSRPVVANPSTFLREGTGGLEPDNSLTSFNGKSSGAVLGSSLLKHVLSLKLLRDTECNWHP